jgi:hypothetical protein
LHRIPLKVFRSYIERAGIDESLIKSVLPSPGSPEAQHITLARRPSREGLFVGKLSEAGNGARAEGSFRGYYAQFWIRELLRLSTGLATR